MGQYHSFAEGGITSVRHSMMKPRDYETADWPRIFAAGATEEPPFFIVHSWFGKPIAEISIARLLGQLFQITEAFEMQTQPQLLLLQKSMLLAEGVGRTLAPQVNMWEMAQPLIENWMRERLGPEGQIADAVGTTLDTLRKLPHIIDRVDAVTADMARGGLRLHPDTARAIRGEENGKRRVPWMLWAPWLLAAALLAALLFR
jgi:ubiquinone biosynthesis protein